VNNYDSAISTPIVSSAAFAYKNSEEAQNIFCGFSPKPLYSRMGNPTSMELEKKLANHDGGVGAVCTSSGMGAISMVVTSLIKNSDEIISIGGLFGGNYAFFSETLPRFGVKTHFLTMDQIDTLEEYINDNTKIIFCESVGNPNLRLSPIEKIASYASKHNIAFLVDNTTTPYLKPIEKGADVVLYSTTKIISGNSSALGGAAIFRSIKNDNEKFRSNRYEFLQKFIEKLDTKALIGCAKKRALRDFGMSANAHASYQTLLGLETLNLRNEKVKSSCEYLAKNLFNSGINVNHPSLSDHVDNDLYKSDYKDGSGSILTIDMKTKEKAFIFLDNLKNVILTANIGDSRTLALHMGSTIYRDFTDTEKAFLGITDGLIRFSIGLEDPKEILDDIMNAIECAHNECKQQQ
jgi:O-acetylhomoserine (thiol)-lyase